ncbi:hypothetical protein [Sphingomonas montanisoli]|nr:hypothetical protein [Sphingomonas montanisoli]
MPTYMPSSEVNQRGGPMNSDIAMTADASAHFVADRGGVPIAEKDAKASRLFVHFALICIIILQRFGVLLGSGAIFAALPGMFMLLAWLVWTGRARLDTEIALYYLAFIATVGLSTMFALSFPDNRVSLSVVSSVAVLITYSLLLIKPGKRFDRTVVLDIFMFYARLCTVLGIVQYLVQFVGLSVFALGTTFPFLKPILVEQVFNFDPLTTWGGSIRRATGIFLLEPSILSQLLVLAAAIDFFLYRRLLWLPAYAVAYMFTYSGTGALSILLALPPFALLFYRQAGRLLTLAIVGVGLLAVTAVLVPDQLNSITNRSNELSSTRSSGYARFVGQFEVLATVIDEPRVLIGYGPGALERATFFRRGTAGTAQKPMIDYGIIGFLVFLALVLKAFWRWDMAILPLVVLMQFMTGGGYFIFFPLIAQYALLLIWAAPPKPFEGRPASAGAEAA